MDDGSPDQTATNYIEEYVKLNLIKCKNVIVRKQPENKGKRHAQAYAFKNSDADIFFTVDSDSYIYPNELEELLKPFNDSEF